MTIDKILAASTVIPVLEVTSLDKAAPLAKALAAGGLRVVELTLRTDCALAAVAAMKAAAPNLMVGMGTVRTSDDISASLEAGADFLVSPGASAALLDALAASGAPALPGVATASEAMTAHDAGFAALKFFPAEASGGIAYLKSLSGPLPELSFCATGGITAERAPDYLALSNVACVGGSWIAARSHIENGDWATIEANAKKAASIR